MPETSTIGSVDWKKEVLEQDQKIERFAQFVNAGINSWINAGNLLVEMKDKDPDIFSRITGKFPGISWDILRVFEDIGRKRIYPYLMLDNCPGSRKLLTFPYGEQVKLYQAKIDVVVAVKNGQPVVEKKRIQELSSFEIDRIFFGERVASIPEQAAFFENKNSLPKSQARPRTSISQSEAKPAPTAQKSKEEDPALEDLTRIAFLLAKIERHCPCGARPENLKTHPHVNQCPVKEALDIALKYV